MKAGGQKEKEKDAPQPQADAVKVSISQEGIENYRKQLRESGLGGANDYGNALARETEKLKGQRKQPGRKDKRILEK